MKRLSILTLMLTFATNFGCQGNGQIVKTGEQTVNLLETPNSKSSVKLGVQFTLKKDESAKVEGADIEIIVNRIGRKWTSKSESLDFTFSVNHDGKSEMYSNPLPDLITAGEYKIEVVKTEPFGDGYAIFVVTKIESVKKAETSKPNSTDEAAAKFVGQFGWHIEETIAPTKVPIEFPKNFDGLPFYHYQLVSQQSGVDMTPLLGKTVEMLKYTLREKQSEQGKDFSIFAHLIVENGKVVGAWRTDSSSRAPGIYSFVKK